MLQTVVILLVLLWLLGVVTSYTLGGLVHILLVIAVIVVLLRIIREATVATRPLPENGHIRDEAGVVSSADLDVNARMRMPAPLGSPQTRAWGHEPVTCSRARLPWRSRRTRSRASRRAMA